jgi:hypothetical protein
VFVFSLRLKYVLVYLVTDIGEKVLREEKEARDVHQRIMDIEMELKKLKEISEDETEVSAPGLERSQCSDDKKIIHL